MTDEIDRVLALADHTPAQVAELYPPYPYDQTRADRRPGRGRRRRLRAGRHRGRRPATRSGRRTPTARGTPAPACGPGVDRLPALLGRGDGIGSNAWVVDGEHSATGEPLLANDPHLGVTMPGVWMQMGLHCRTVSADCPLDVAGFTFSGVPGVVIGHNADIAWGFTNLGPDVSDLYLERVVGDQWQHDGRLPAARRSATRRSRSRGGDDVELTVRSTAHGPLLSDVSDELADVGEQAPADHPRRRGERVRRRPGVDGAAAGRDRRRDPRARHRPPTGTSSAPRPPQFAVPGAEHGLRRPRGPHRLPGAGPDPDPQVRQRRLPARPRAGAPTTTGPATTCRSTALPSVLDPEEGFVVTANQAVIGARLPLLPHRRLGPRLPLAADPRPARGGGRAVGRRDGRRSSSTTAPARADAGAVPARASSCRGGYYARRPAAAARLGLHAAAPTARRRRTSTWSGATCSS